MSSLPIVQLTVRGLEHSVYAALSEHEAQMAYDVRAAIARACEPANVQSVVDETVAREMRAIVGRSVESALRYGPINKAVREAIEGVLGRVAVEGGE